MYKVFIQNKPLFFISIDEMNDFNGFFIREYLALNEKQHLLSAIKLLPKTLNIYILCEDPKETMMLFFKTFKKIEAAGGIVNRKEKYLFIKRNGVWDIPKGKLESKESPEEGAKREIEEECGIENVEIGDLITITYHTYLINGENTLKKTYWFKASYTGDKKGVPQHIEGITKIAWKKKDSIHKIRLNTYSSIEDVIDFYFPTNVVI